MAICLPEFVPRILLLMITITLLRRSLFRLSVLLPEIGLNVDNKTQGTGS